jgi:hypothetical protein
LDDVSFVKAMKMQKKTHLQTQTQVDFVAPSTLRGHDVFLRAAVDGMNQARAGGGVFVDAPMTIGSTYAEHFPPFTEATPAPPQSCRVPEMSAVSSLPIQKNSHYRESFDGTGSTTTSFDFDPSQFVAASTLRVSDQPFNPVTKYHFEFQYRGPIAPAKSCKPDVKVQIQHYPKGITSEYGKTYGYEGRRKRGRPKYTTAAAMTREQ